MKSGFIFLCEISTTNNLSISRVMSGEACQEVDSCNNFLSAFPYNGEIVYLWKKELFHVIHTGATNVCHNSSQKE